MMTRAEAAEYLRVSPRTIDRWCRERGLPYERAGARKRFRRAALDAWLKQPNSSTKHHVRTMLEGSQWLRQKARVRNVIPTS